MRLALSPSTLFLFAPVSPMLNSLFLSLCLTSLSYVWAGWLLTRFEDDFFIDLIFAPVTNPSVSSTTGDDTTDAATETNPSDEGSSQTVPSSFSSSADDASAASATADSSSPPSSSSANGDATPDAPTGSANEGKGNEADNDNGTGAMNSALLRRERGIVVDPGASTAYDAMLHRDGNS